MSVLKIDCRNLWASWTVLFGSFCYSCSKVVDCQLHHWCGHGGPLPPPHSDPERSWDLHKTGEWLQEGGYYEIAKHEKVLETAIFFARQAFQPENIDVPELHYISLTTVYILFCPLNKCIRMLWIAFISFNATDLCIIFPAFIYWFQMANCMSVIRDFDHMFCVSEI